jgi:hypothetical protein
VHDNLFEYIFEPHNNSPHGNVIESLGGIAGSTTATYNNIFRNFNVGQGIQPLGDHQYIFNNVFENDQHFPPDPNCIFIAPSIFASGGINGDVHVVNNTVDNTCGAQIFGGNQWTKHFTAPSTFEFGNDHILGRTSISGFLTIGSGASGTIVDDGGEVFQSLSAANSEGYTLANDFQPTSGGGATVGAGNSISSSCSTFSADNALCSGTGNGAMEGAADVAVSPVIPIVQRASAWDAGAHEFGTAGTKPNPPTGLAAVVQ